MEVIWRMFSGELRTRFAVLPFSASNIRFFRGLEENKILFFRKIFGNPYALRFLKLSNETSFAGFDRFYRCPFCLDGEIANLFWFSSRGDKSRLGFRFSHELWRLHKRWP